MIYRKFGRSNVKVSSLCLGTGNFGYSSDFPGNWAATGEKEAFKIMDAALEAGINFFDCANVYGNHAPGTSGDSERIIGKWFKQGGWWKNTGLSFLSTPNSVMIWAKSPPT